MTVARAVFYRVWVFLLALTAVEVGLAYVQASPFTMLAVLMGLSIAKAYYIVCYFMHMKYESPRLRLSLFPALILCILALLALLPDAARAQCAMCQRNAAAQNERQARRMNQAILVLSLPPVGILAAILARAASRR